MMTIAVMLPNWIGDVAMATPALRALRRHFSDRRLIGVMRPYVASVLEGAPWLDESIVYESGRGTVLRLVARLRPLRVDQMLLLTNSFSTALVGFLAGARRRVGFTRYGRRVLLTDVLRAPRDGRRWVPRSAVDHYLEIAAHVGCPPSSKRLELQTTPADDEAADAVWRRFGFEDAAGVVVLNTGGAYGAAKSWPDESFAAVARRVVRELDAAVLVLCGPGERDAARRIVALAAHQRVASLADEPVGIGLSKACVKRSRLMITTDSGPRHFAAAFNVPAVTLFGPTDPRWAHNYHPRSADLHLDLDCRPCARRICPLGHHRCMRELDADQVFASAAKLLDVEQSTLNKK